MKRSTAGLSALLLLLSLVAIFVSIELVQRKRFQDKNRDLTNAIRAFEAKVALTLDADGVLIRPARGPEPVLGRFTHLIGTNDGYYRATSWYLSAKVRNSKDAPTADHDVRFELLLLQHRTIILRSPRVLLDWPYTLSRSVILPLLDAALREQGIDYSLVDRGF